MVNFTLLHTNVVKQLGVYLDEELNGEFHCQQLFKKLNRSNGMLAKTRHYVPNNELKNMSTHAYYIQTTKQK